MATLAGALPIVRVFAMTDRPSNSFHTTRWTQVLAAGGKSPDAKQALRELCETYYSPVELFVRRYRGEANAPPHDDARDLTHDFFAKLLEGHSLDNVDRTRGRFRSYLLGAVKHFLADQADRSLAAKRGGGQSILSLDANNSDDDNSEDRLHARCDVADPWGFPPDAYFDHQWALAIVERAMNHLEVDSQKNGECERFAVLRRWLVTPSGQDTAVAAARSLHLSDAAFKVAVHRLRKRFRQLVKEQIAATVDGPEAIQEELEYLVQALMA